MRFAGPNNPLRAKLGLHCLYGNQYSIDNATVVAIPDTHSIILESYQHIRSYSQEYNHFHTSLMAGNNWLALYINSTVGELRHSVRDAAGTDYDYFPQVFGKVQQIIIGINRDTNRKFAYVNGELELNEVLTRNPTFNAPNNRVFIHTAGYNTAWDADIILARFTTLSSVPADIDAAIKWQYQFPMNGLHTSIQANLGSIASEWNFEDQILNSTQIIDRGLIGGFDLVSSVNLQTLMRIVEKP